MTQENKVTLTGRVSGVAINGITKTHQAVSFIVTTQHVYKSSDGAILCEMTHVPCKAISSDRVNIGPLRNGCAVHLEGTLKNMTYCTTDGTERSTLEVMATTLEVIPD